MAQDATIKLVLDTQTFLSQVKNLDKELSKALSKETGSKDLQRRQQTLKENSKEIREQVGENGKNVDAWKKSLDIIQQAREELNASQKIVDKLKPKSGLDKAFSQNKRGVYSDKTVEEANARLETLHKHQDIIAEKQRIIDEEVAKLPTSLENMPGYAEALARGLSSQVTKARSLTQDIEKQEQALKKQAETESQLTPKIKENANAKKQETDASKKAADATEQQIKAAKQLNEEESKLQAKKKSTATPKATPTTAPASSPNQVKTFKELVAEISRLRNSGKDASKEFSELETRLRSFDTASASAADLEKFLMGIREALAYIKKDLDMPENLKDVFNSLTAGKAPAQKAKSTINKQNQLTGNDAATQATKKEQIAKETAQLEKEMAARLAAQEKFEAQQKVQQEREQAELQKELAQRQAAEELFNAKQKAYLEKRAADRQKIYDKVNAQQQKEVQAKQAYIQSMLAADTQYQEDFRNSMQSVIDTTDRVSKAMHFDGANTGIAELVRRLEELKQAKATLENFGLPKEMDGRYDMLNRMIAETVQKINEYKASLNGSVSATNKAGNAGKDAGNKIKKAFNPLAPLLKSIKTHFKEMSKASDRVKSAFNGMASNMRSNFKHMITSLTKYVLGFRSLFFLVRRLRKYIGEGIQNMAQYNDGNNVVNQSITRLLSSLLYLKNAWATAFSPILSVVTPLLENLIDNLARAGNSFSQFVGRLLGSGSVFQAVKVDAQDYAKSLDNAAGSAGGAADKTKKLTDRLAAFDDLNVLGKDNDPDNTGSGGGGGSLDDYMPDPNEMFTILDVADDIKQKLMDIWNTEDMEEFGAKFKGLGETLASNLKQAFVDLNGKWPEIQTEARKIGVAIGSFLSGLLSDKSLFEEAGKTVAESLDTIGQAISGFFDTYEKGSIGSSIASFFRGVFTNFDWGTAGANLGELVTTFFTEWATLMKEFPTEEFTNGLEEFFAGIDWSAVISSIVSAIFSTVSFIGKFIKGIGEALMNITAEDIIDAFSEVDTEEIAEALGDLFAGIIAITFASIKLPIEIWKALMIAIGNAWVDAMDDAGVLGDFQKALEDGDWLGMGKALVEGLGYGIVEAFDDAGQWVADYLVAPIVDNFKELFGIHSPSTVFEEFGINLIEGLKQGIEGLINSVMDPFNQLATDLFNKWNEIKGDAYEKWVGMKTSIKEKAGEIKTDVEEKFNTLKTNLVNKWQEIKGAIYEKLVGIKINMTDVFEQIGTAIKSPINAIIDLIEGMVNKCIDGINALTSGLSAFTELGSEALKAMNMPEIPRLGQLSHVTIPHLAQGAVIPPNKEFMAVLGDQSRGTNIEAPLDTIKQAMAEVLANNGNAEVIQLLQQLITVVESKNLVIGDKDIGKANARYVKQQNIVRGSTF